jgi:hypothetical protein
MLSSFRDDLTGLKILPEVLKVDSDATVEIGTAKMSFVSLAEELSSTKQKTFLSTFHNTNFSYIAYEMC